MKSQKIPAKCLFQKHCPQSIWLFGKFIWHARMHYNYSRVRWYGILFYKVQSLFRPGTWLTPVATRSHPHSWSNLTSCQLKL